MTKRRGRGSNKKKKKKKKKTWRTRRGKKKEEDEEEAGNKLYKRTTHGAQEGARRLGLCSSMWYRRNIYDFSVTMPGDLPYIQRLNRSFRMKRIGGSTARHHVGGASAARARTDLTLTLANDLPRFNAPRPRETRRDTRQIVPTSSGNFGLYPGENCQPISIETASDLTGFEHCEHSNTRTHFHDEL